MTDSVSWSSITSARPQRLGGLVHWHPDVGVDLSVAWTAMGPPPAELPGATGTGSLSMPSVLIGCSVGPGQLASRSSRERVYELYADVHRKQYYLKLRGCFDKLKTDR